VKNRDKFESSDFHELRSVTDVSFSPDGQKIAYTVEDNRGVPRPCSQIRIFDLETGADTPLESGAEFEGSASSSPEWSPDSNWIAYCGGTGERSGLWIRQPAGAEARFLGELQGTNAPMPGTGKRVTWSPDSGWIAFVSAVGGPQHTALGEDPVVISRYLYKPNHGEGLSHFNDNRRFHIFVTDIQTGERRAVTDGESSEHSIEWSPIGDEIVFASNREPDSDRFFKYDLFAIGVGSGKLERLTAGEGVAYRPRWSRDGKSIAYLGTRRGLTNLETNMEDAHVYILDRATGSSKELAPAIDNRHGPAAWSQDGKWIYFTVLERGTNRLYRVPAGGGPPEIVAGDGGFVISWSVSAKGAIACSIWSDRDTAQLFLTKSGEEAGQITNLNRDFLATRESAKPEAFTCISNDHKFNIEAFLTKPPDLREGQRCPLITIVHGGPHNLQGPMFYFQNQVYAARGWATLMVNYRGSTGYGQGFCDAIFRDQNGDEAQDVLYALGAALRRNRWIDSNRLGIEGCSYGGQLTAWLITQTRIFKAAIAIAAPVNLISCNYMAYYNQYEQMEWGVSPHQGGMMDVLWERSPLKHVGKIATPTMLIHGENDSDVPIAEAEQFYIALHDIGVETIMVRYPREGHAIRESKHIVDQIARSVAWYEKHFSRVQASRNITDNHIAEENLLLMGRTSHEKRSYQRA